MYDYVCIDLSEALPEFKHSLSTYSINIEPERIVSDLINAVCHSDAGGIDYYLDEFLGIVEANEYHTFYGDKFTETQLNGLVLSIKNLADCLITKVNGLKLFSIPEDIQYQLKELKNDNLLIMEQAY